VEIFKVVDLRRARYAGSLVDTVALVSHGD